FADGGDLFLERGDIADLGQAIVQELLGASPFLLGSLLDAAVLIALPFELGEGQRRELGRAYRVDTCTDLAQLAAKVLDQLAQRPRLVGRHAAALRLQLGQSNARRAVSLGVTDAGLPSLGRGLHVGIGDAGPRVDRSQLPGALIRLCALGSPALPRRAKLRQLRVKLLDSRANLLCLALGLATGDEVPRGAQRLAPVEPEPVEQAVELLPERLA